MEGKGKITLFGFKTYRIGSGDDLSAVISGIFLEQRELHLFGGGRHHTVKAVLHEGVELLLSGSGFLGGVHGRQGGDITFD